MTKLSQIREEYDRASRGEWLRFRDTTICVRVRGFLTNGYQRALRAVLASFERLPDDATAEARIQRDEDVGRAMIQHLPGTVLLDWWGVDSEAEPLAMDGTPELLGEAGGIKVETLSRDGKLYRPIDGDGEWQEMVPFSEAVAVLSEARCAELLDVVRAAAGVVDAREIRREAEALGKRVSSSSGKSSTATTPKK